MIDLRTLIAACCTGAVCMTVAAKSQSITMEPPFWWAGMNEKSVQVMIHSDGIRDASTTIENSEQTGVTIDSIVRLDSPNYQIIYLNTANATAGSKVNFTFKSGKKKQKAQFELRERDGKMPSAFDASDVLYLIMPDRFADGDPMNNVVSTMNYPVAIDRSDPSGRHGGDIKGVEKHLDYIDSLGVTAIWLNPVLENDMPGGSYHGYATTDYYRVDPRIGTNEDYVSFIQKAHNRNLKVVMDMIFNHSGSEHPWMKDMPSNDWYNHTDGKVMSNFRLSTINDPYVSDYDVDKTVKGWFVPAMPDLNQENPHLMKYLVQNSIWWIEYSKIDGIRMDTYPYADMKPMADWIKAVHKEYPDYNIVGECWYGDAAGTAYWQRNSILNSSNTELPTVMDFPTMLLANKAFNDTTLSYGGGLNEVYNRLSLDYLYKDPQKVLTFLDNHDTDRFLLEAPKNLNSWKQAIAFLLTTRGIPQIYYGTELLMSGTKAITDGYIRLDVPGGFPGDSHDEFTRAGRTAMQNEAYDFISRIAHWRKGNEIISKGKLKHFMPENGLYVYERKYNGKHVVVIMNGNDSVAENVDMSRYREIITSGTLMTDVITGQRVVIAQKMTFAPRAVMILE